MKTKVRMKSKDQRYREWEKDETGYIDGYIRGGDEVPYAVVIIDSRIVLVPPNQLIVIK